MLTGYRRRILIEPIPGQVTAELEDDYHRMVVTLTHKDGIATTVSSEMKRSPWTLCPGAMAQLAGTYTGQPLAGFARHGDKTQNCTHLHDLALFAAAHAQDSAATAYDIFVTDPVDGLREARLTRNGESFLNWQLEGEKFLVPAELAGRSTSELGDWIAGQDKTTAEAARILRWAGRIAHGRRLEIPAGLSATTYARSTCYNFQPDRAAGSHRRPGADIDFSQPGAEPMADRAEAFT